MQRISINGVQAEYISVMDRGLHYGDGVFETIACVNNQLQFWPQHLTRMAAGAEKLKINFPDERLWLHDVQQLFDAQISGEPCIIKLMLTRGIGERGYRHPAKPVPSRIAIRTDWPDNTDRVAERGARIRLCETRLSVSPQLAGIKHLNRLDNVLARNEWQDEYDEGLMMDFQDNIIEGTMSNVFAIKQGVVYTPALDRCGVNGIIRQQLLLIANELNMRIQESNITQAGLAEMDEMLLTNSVIGIWPVTEFADTKYTIGDTGQLLAERLAERVGRHAQTVA
jgi:4-amino-4-deoxychorismate lyase